MAVSVRGSVGGAPFSPTSGGAAPGAPADDGTGSRAAAAATSLYPLLFAVFPVLSVAGSSTGTYLVGDLLRIVATVVVGTAIVLAVCAAGVRLLGRSVPLARGALLALAVVAWFFYFVPLQSALFGALGKTPFSRGIVLGPLFLVPTVALVRVALRRRPPPAGLGSRLTLAALLLVGLSALRVARENAGSREHVLRSAVWRQVSAPVPVQPALARSPKRDIYLLILDGYPNAAVLRTRFGFDNGPFLDSLRALGFTIPRHLRSNYSQTMLSVPSLLNFEHVTSLAEDLAPASRDHRIVTQLAQQNRAARFLRSQGYSYLLFPLQWFEPTRYSPLASWIYPGPPRTSVVDAVLSTMQTTELRRVVVYSTLLQKVRAMSRGYGAPYILDQFRALREVPLRREPTFAVAHIPAGHSPYLLDAQCRPKESDVVVGQALASVGARSEFLGSIQCSNRQVLGVVRELLRRSEVAPIILVLGDHGTLSRGWPGRAGYAVDSAATERFSALGAFHLPDGGDAAFADSVTHVNIFRNVLRYYFGADLPPVSNESFFSDGDEAYRFLPVDERLVIGG